MKKLKAHSKSSLFLMEMILSIFVLTLTATVCVQFFAAAKVQRQKAHELNHIQELTSSVGEMLEGKDAEDLGVSDSESVQYFYDPDWNLCSEDSAKYTMTVQFTFTATVKKADILFLDDSGDALYDLSISFPRTQRS